MHLSPFYSLIPFSTATLPPKGTVNYINGLRHNCNVLAPGYQNVFPCRPLSYRLCSPSMNANLLYRLHRILSVTPEILKNYTAAANTNASVKFLVGIPAKWVSSVDMNFGRILITAGVAG